MLEPNEDKKKADCPEEFSKDEWEWIKPMLEILKNNGVTCSRGSLALMADLKNYYEKEKLESLTEARQQVAKQKDERIAELEKRVKELEIGAMGRNSMIKARDEEISRLKAENESLHKDVEANQKLCQDKHELMASERSKWSNQREQIQSLTSRLSEALGALKECSGVIKLLDRDRKYESVDGTLDKIKSVLIIPDNARLLERERLRDAVIKSMGAFKLKFEAFSKYQNQHLSKGIEEAEKCWAEVSDSSMLDFSDLFKALEALEAHEKSEGV